jgi:hypothetical protein
MQDNEHEKDHSGLFHRSGTVCGMPMVAFIYIAIAAAQTFHWV